MARTDLLEPFVNCLMQASALLVVEIISVVIDDELELRAFRQRCRLVEDEAAISNARAKRLHDQAKV